MVTLRDATERDSAAIARLHADSWRSAYRGIMSDEYLDNRAYSERAALWQARFSEKPNKPFFTILAETDGQLAGFACVFPNEDPIFASFLDTLHSTPPDSSSFSSLALRQPRLGVAAVSRPGRALCDEPQHWPWPSRRIRFCAGHWRGHPGSCRCRGRRTVGAAHVLGDCVRSGEVSWRDVFDLFGCAKTTHQGSLRAFTGCSSYQAEPHFRARHRRQHPQSKDRAVFLRVSPAICRCLARSGRVANPVSRDAFRRHGHHE